MVGAFIDEMARRAVWLRKNIGAGLWRKSMRVFWGYELRRGASLVWVQQSRILRF
jgi:hypothetical protein